MYRRPRQHGHAGPVCPLPDRQGVRRLPSCDNWKVTSSPPASSGRRRRTSRPVVANLSRNMAAKCPDNLEALVTLPGVGRKTANVVLGDCFGVPGITVDTHVGRLEPPARADDAHRPGQGRTGHHAATAGEGLGDVQPPHDHARPAGLLRAEAGLRALCAGEDLPEDRCGNQGETMNTLLDRFLRYVRIDTQADEQTTAYPSSPGQLDLGRMLVGELRGIGLRDAEQDEHGIVLATIPATTNATHPSSPGSRTSTPRRKRAARTSSRSSTAITPAATSCCPAIRPRCSGRPTFRN